MCKINELLPSKSLSGVITRKTFCQYVNGMIQCSPLVSATDKKIFSALRSIFAWSHPKHTILVGTVSNPDIRSVECTFRKLQRHQGNNVDHSWRDEKRDLVSFRWLSRGRIP